MKTITLTETGLRDGIQALPEILPTALKVSYIHELVAAGFRKIEVAAFVHPKYVPAMADAEKICAAIDQQTGVDYRGLVLNEKGLNRALTTPLDSVSSIVYATDSFSRKNARMSFKEAKENFRIIAQKARANHLPIQGSVSAAFGCRYEGKVSHQVVIDLVKFLLDQDIQEIGLADTTGMGIPNQLHDLCAKVLELAGSVPVNLHLHNTENRGYANLYAALQAGITHFDTSFGGLGGCPFMPNASGNIATEDTVYMLHQMGYETGVDIGKVTAVSRKMETFLGKELDGMLYRIWANL